MSLTPSLRRAHLPPASPSLSPLSLSPIPAPSTRPQPHTQIRHATLLRRPKRPYTFTQLVALSDGSTYTQRTTSPTPVYRSAKDARNTPLWNPSNEKVLSYEADEAGKLRAFREKFGRGWDAGGRKGGDEGEGDEGEGDEGEGEDNLVDLISGFGGKGEGEGEGEKEGRSGKGKGKEKEKEKGGER